MSLLLQALLGANVDGSGLSLHVDVRTSLDMCDIDDMPIAKEVGRSFGRVWSCHLVLYIFVVRRASWEEKSKREATRDSRGPGPLQSPRPNVEKVESYIKDKES